MRTQPLSFNLTPGKRFRLPTSEGTLNLQVSFSRTGLHASWILAQLAPVKEAPIRSFP